MEDGQSAELDKDDELMNVDGFELKLYTISKRKHANRLQHCPAVKCDIT